jgi:eukaryotic-like serine/threonine-protein kinase
MAPEQAGSDHKPDARSDIYSLGAVAYYLLTAQPPFNSTNAIKVMVALLHEPVVPPSHHRPDVPADLEAVVMRCLAKEPEDRYPNATTLARALADCEASGRWTREAAARWWQTVERQAFDQQSVERQGVERQGVERHELSVESPVAAG